MMNTADCERCSGSGADPMQSYIDDVVALCVECRGDGVVVVFDDAPYYEELRLTA
jgi:DnaJ-class molecular chaperone